MSKVIFAIIISVIIIFSTSFEVNSYQISQERIDKLSIKVSKKFSRTYCNTSNFGISKEGAIEFAIGETDKEYVNNKDVQYLDSNKIINYIIAEVQKDCQAYDFPSEELIRLNLIKK